MRTAGLAHERGAGTVTVLATVATGLVLLVGGLGLGTAAAAAARAGAAADLAALAAADALRGLVPSEPCALAEQTAARHGAALTRCELQQGGTALVAVSLPGPLPWPAEGAARAGPPAVGAAGHSRERPDR